MKKSVLTLILLVATCMSAFAEKRITLKPEGELYPIAEKDALEEIKEKVAGLDLEKLKMKARESAERQLILRSEYQRACENSTFSFYPVYTLEVDIKDEKGNVIYPKGYTFNPLDYMPFPFTFVFFDGSSEKEVEWVKKNFKDTDGVFLVTTGGNVFEVAKKLERPVYAMNELMKKRFLIKRTPSIVRAVKNYLVVQEVGIYDCGNKKQKNKN